MITFTEAEMEKIKKIARRNALTEMYEMTDGLLNAELSKLGKNDLCLKSIILIKRKLYEHLNREFTKMSLKVKSLEEIQNPKLDNNVN